jgi:hypothetical protein
MTPELVAAFFDPPLAHFLLQAGVDVALAAVALVTALLIGGVVFLLALLFGPGVRL